MPKKTKVLSDKYKSTTKIYPKVIMESLTPEVRAYIEGAGDNKYVTQQEESEPYVSTIEQSGDDIVLTVEDTELGGSCVLRLENGGFNVTLGDATNNYTLELTNTGDFTVQSTEGETIHSLTFDSEGNLKVDGNAVGGGNQLYQHNICLAQTSQVTEYNLYCTIISDRDTAYDFASLTSYLQEQVPQNYGIVLSGKAYYQNDTVVTKFATRIYYSTNQNAIRIEYINTQWTLEYKQLDGTIIDRVKPL